MRRLGPGARHLLGALAIAAVCLLAPPSAASAAVPPGFFGIVPQEAPTESDYSRMDGVVGTLRMPFYWPQLEPSRGIFDFTTIDQEVRLAAQHGIRVLPFVWGSPPWLTASPAESPLRSEAGPGAWSQLLRRLVNRYGPDGSLWSQAGPRLPIREWQIWNEPNFVLFWRPHPSPRAYARLLGLSARAIRAADPGARIVAGGVAPVGAGMLPYRFLEALYRVRGAKKNFDVVALHPYATSLFGVELYVRRTRRAMAEAGDARTPLLIGELGIASDAPRPTAFDKGMRGQAEFLRSAYALLLDRRRRWRISGVDWFSLRDGPAWDPHCAFCQYAGLLDLDGRPKPSWSAYRGIVETAVR